MKDVGYGTAAIQTDEFRFKHKDRRLIKSHLAVAYIAFFIGTLAGLLQTLQRTGFVELPAAVGYYQLLTIHGVYLALIFTTLFIVGYLYSGLAKTLGGNLPALAVKVGWVGFYMMLFGSIFSLLTILNNEASVLYTFYAPLQASPWFYIGLALVVVGSWFSSFAVFYSYWKWKKTHREEKSPLFAYMAVATMILWDIATIGVALEVVVQLIPWSFGWVKTIDVSMSRTLFWYFGHPLVYFWLLPAYIYWYVNIPRIIKGQMFSDALPRLTFVLFILYSIPVGFHHQLMEPGISEFWKFLQVILTMIVVIPSLMTVFAMFATFELSGRSLGAKGRFGWIKKLPWKDVRFFAPVMGMVLFIPAGAGGIINASHQLNTVVHNTLWVTGHFHLTLAASVVLTYFAASYWLIPLLTGRSLTPLANKLGLLQTSLWTIGVFIMGVSMHIVGILGEPRRISFTTYNNHPIVETWIPFRQLIAIGGVMLYSAALLFVGIIIYLWFFSPKTKEGLEYPIGEVGEGAEKPPAILERWSVWVGLTVALIIIAYAYPVWQMIQHDAPGSPPLRTW